MTVCQSLNLQKQNMAEGVDGISIRADPEENNSMKELNLRRVSN
jgi:hypothetical protein